jgi:Peptidase C39 family
MSNTPFTVPFEGQANPQLFRGCGAACLSMVYKSFGKDVEQSAIWPLIAKPNRFGAVSSTTHLMALHAQSQGFSAMAIQSRHPVETLRRCREAGIRTILNHRLNMTSPDGHYSVLVDVGEKTVTVHDPLQGPSRTITHEELLQLLRPLAPNSEIAGNVLIGIALDPEPVPACEFCHTAMPASWDCPRCGKPVILNPAAMLGCVRDGCIARMWNYVACPSCDFLFNESGKGSAQAPQPDAAASSMPTLELPDLDAAFAKVDAFTSELMRIPGVAQHPDVKTQIDFINLSKDQARIALADTLATLKGRFERATAAEETVNKKVDEHKQKLAEVNAPLEPLDGNALGQALLKNLGFS